MVALLAVALGAAYQFWFRDSSLVEVRTVTIEGIPEEGGRSFAIREALVAAGRSQTTLNLNESEIQEAVSEYPEVESIETSTSFPNGLEITVSLHAPVARIGDGSEAWGVASDGTVLPQGSASGMDIPALPLTEPPDSGVLRGPSAEQVAVLGAAPREFLMVSEATRYRDEMGPVVILKAGIELRFGSTERLEEKWAAVAAVLADPELDQVGYIDLSSPSRPAVGGVAVDLPSPP